MGTGSGGVRHQRSHEGVARFVPGGDRQARGHGVDRLDDRVAGRPFGHDQAAGAGAALAGGDESGIDDDRGGGLRAVPRDQRIIAAQFQRHDDMGPIDQRAAQGCASPCRSGKEQSIYVARDQRFARGAATLNDGQQAVRQARSGPGIGHRRAGGRRDFRWLEDDGIARDQGGDDMAVGQMAREIIGAKHRHHAMAAMAQHGATKGHGGGTLAGALGMGRDRDIDLGDHRPHFGVAFPQQLAGFARDKFRQRSAPFGEHPSIAAHHSDAILHGQRAPSGQGGAGGGDRAMAGGGIGDRAFPDEGAGGGIEGLQHGGHAPARVMAKMPVALPVSKARSS